MNENKTGFLKWVKNHKKQLALAGISIVVIVGIVVDIKNKDALMKLWNELEDSIKKTPKDAASYTRTINVDMPSIVFVETTTKYTMPQTPFNVSQHVRNLSDGRQHSVEKEAEALSLGIHLLENQTLVDPYTKGAMAA